MRPPLSKPVIASLLLSGVGALILIVMLVSESDKIAGKATHANTLDSAANIGRGDITSKIGGAFTLLNTNAQAISDHHYRGQYLLIYFGFTYCPDVCPTALARLSDALEQLEPTESASIQPLFISVDPERDTPATLRDYVRHFHPRLEGLTGSTAQIENVKRQYRIYAAKVADDTTTDGYTIDHSSIIYFMDKQNRFLTHFTDTQTSTDIATALKKLITK
ncbi:MAG: SCO family protein [Alphaproteobacteria bacterium]|nr:SCO family protein [Alphaproteobacteria bacterium]